VGRLAACAPVGNRRQLPASTEVLRLDKPPQAASLPHNACRKTTLAKDYVALALSPATELCDMRPGQHAAVLLKSVRTGQLPLADVKAFGDQHPAEFFRELVEPLADSFEPADVAAYEAVMQAWLPPTTRAEPLSRIASTLSMSSPVSRSGRTSRSPASPSMQ